jgi:hypothetical protein
LDEDHCCRALGAYSKPGLEISLASCTITDAGASALAEVLGRNQGPTKLDGCHIDNFVLANGLRGNSRLKCLKLHLPDFRDGTDNDDGDVGNRELLAIASALRENEGLVDLDLNYGPRVNDETWGAICDSLETHPTLEVLHLRCIRWGRCFFAVPAPSVPTSRIQAPLVPTSRIQALLDMMKVNTSIHTMHLDACYSQHELYCGSVIPYLETNRLRPRLLAIQQARPISYRAKVFGQALLATRTDANSLWMLLSGNAEVVFLATTATTTTAASLPTCATAAATSNVASIWCCCFYH